MKDKQARNDIKVLQQTVFTDNHIQRNRDSREFSSLATRVMLLEEYLDVVRVYKPSRSYYKKRRNK
ncbi:hypothetical protein LCGC14_1711060 [marine sediment metagenome]|uniref:Uncharacterized protein n=1 Tax=marine sediment metagenome TaxID=412755 RepID=A0A0F9HFP7_9ZZZZ